MMKKPKLFWLTGISKALVLIVAATGLLVTNVKTAARTLSPDELINPVSTLSGKHPVKKKTTHWYLPLGKHEDFLREWILKEHKDDWRKTVVGQCKGWIDGGLQSRAVTRDLDWGIKVSHPERRLEGKVLYVWFDAPIGYISATKQWAIDNNKDWKPYWEDKDTKLVHFVGKDNIVFHCIIFPIMLKLHGNILPDNVPANEFLNLEGDKMSTSRNWKLEMRDYINDFVKKGKWRRAMCGYAALLSYTNCTGNKRQRIYLERFPGCSEQ